MLCRMKLMGCVFKCSAFIIAIAGHKVSANLYLAKSDIESDRLTKCLVNDVAARRPRITSRLLLSLSNDTRSKRRASLTVARRAVAKVGLLSVDSHQGIGLITLLFSLLKTRHSERKHHESSGRQRSRSRISLPFTTFWSRPTLVGGVQASILPLCGVQIKGLAGGSTTGGPRLGGVPHLRSAATSMKIIGTIASPEGAKSRWCRRCGTNTEIVDSTSHHKHHNTSQHASYIPTPTTDADNDQ
jgi:hypothetical protein